jgi:precorrin-3B C17-methyltransferase
MKTLYLISTGPGDLAYLSPRAQWALQQCQHIVGYGLYLDLLGDAIQHSQQHTLALGQETKRAELALDLAVTGKVTGLVSSGDIGIYAMATLVFELLDHQAKPEWQDINIEVIPGISALQALASRVGAPLAHDFCTISLSDLLTPWTTIEKRIHAAGQGDFVVSFYNPVSRKRRWQLETAKQILLKYKKADTPVILGQNLCRDTESIQITTLAELDIEQVDMLTLVMIGNQETRIIDNHSTSQNSHYIYTPRGYQAKQ